MNFADPALLASSGSVYTGVPVGKSLLLPDTGYIPQVAFTNFSNAPQTVTVTMAATLNGFNDRHQVASLTIPANSSQMTELKGLTGDPGWQNSFLVRATGQPGDVLSKMMFRGTGKLPNIELIAKDELSPYTGGDHPWNIANGIRSTLFLFNHATTARPVTVRIGSGTSVWLKIYDLKPNETKAISINDIKSSQTIDMDGHSLAADSMEGEVAWSTSSPDAPEVTGRVVQVDSTGTMARNFSCNMFTNLCGVIPSYNPFAINFGTGQTTSTINGIPQYCSDDQRETCVDNGQYTNSAKTLNWSWSSENTSIAQISSGASSQTSAWQGMAIGNTTLDLEAGLNGAFCQGQGQVNVVPSVTIAGPTSVPLLNSGSRGYDSVQEVASGTPSGGTYQWVVLSGQANVTLINDNQQTVSVQSLSVGSATIQVTYTQNGQTAIKTIGLIVQQPASLLVTSDPSVTFNCRNLTPDHPPYTGPERLIQYQVADSSGKPIAAPNMYVAESFNPISNTCADVTAVPNATAGNTLSDGSFPTPDQLVMCSISCLPADQQDKPTGSCQLVVGQTWKANGYIVQTKNTTYSCPAITLQ